VRGFFVDCRNAWQNCAAFAVLSCNPALNSALASPIAHPEKANIQPSPICRNHGQARLPGEPADLPYAALNSKAAVPQAIDIHSIRRPINGLFAVGTDFAVYSGRESI
jgi:hypothetical protein